jgi:hypothetical protein
MSAHFPHRCSKFSFAINGLPDRLRTAFAGGLPRSAEMTGQSIPSFDIAAVACL